MELLTRTCHLDPTGWKKRQHRTADLPLFRRSITPRALTWKRPQ